MNFFSKLVIGLITAAIATATVTHLHIDIENALQLGLAFAVATTLTAALCSLNLSFSRSAPGAADREQGTVKWFNVSKGFGFIVRGNGEEIFVHFHSIKGEGRRSLRDGQAVTYVVRDSNKGPQAEEVEPA